MGFLPSTVFFGDLLPPIFLEDDPISRAIVLPKSHPCQCRNQQVNIWFGHLRWKWIQDDLPVGFAMNQTPPHGVFVMEISQIIRTKKIDFMKYQGVGNKKQDFGMIWDMSYMLNFRVIPNFMKKTALKFKMYTKEVP